MSLTNAYRKIKGQACGTQPANCGHSLRKRPDVDTRIAELVEEDNKRIELNKEDVIRMLAQILQLRAGSRRKPDPLRAPSVHAPQECADHHGGRLTKIPVDENPTAGYYRNV
jgi:hypothetical protein